MGSLFIFTLKLSETKLTASVLKLDQNTEKAERKKHEKNKNKNMRKQKAKTENMLTLIR